MIIRSNLNKLNAFHEEDHNLSDRKHESWTSSQKIMEDKFKIYNEYATVVKDAAEYSEQILLKLDRLPGRPHA
jgi:hypothetical protein